MAQRMPKPNKALVNYAQNIKKNNANYEAEIAKFAASGGQVDDEVLDLCALRFS